MALSPQHRVAQSDAGGPQSLGELIGVGVGKVQGETADLQLKEMMVMIPTLNRSSLTLYEADILFSSARCSPASPPLASPVAMAASIPGSSFLMARVQAKFSVVFCRLRSLINVSLKWISFRILVSE